MMNRRGSALLIVLGFLSFMVVSAVAFSIYMRSERVPSSVFRKNAAVRQLVKAGLAHAISELDNVIRDDPFPGVIRNPGQPTFYKYMRNANRNIPVDPPYAGLGGNLRYIDWWYGRVFMPPNPDDEEDGSLMAPESETVSVVTLEGLGYLPPPLINDVRILSRGSWSAKWRDFDYGVGRYAYCAVNVSDYFDINRMPVEMPRTSLNRVSLATLFASGNTSAGISSGKISTFRSFVENPGAGGNGAQNSWPLVSMLDYALANESGRSGFTAYPFYQWIYNTTSRRAIYNGATDDARQQIFMTDSWYPPTPAESVAGSAIVDLNHREPEYSSSDKDYGQPFPVDFVKKDNRKSLQDCVSLNTPFFKRVASGMLPSGSPFSDGQNKSFNVTDAALLKDYLDRDDTPISLALPCVERVPMVVSMGFSSFAVNLNLVSSTRTEGPVAAAGGKQKRIEYTEYKLAPGAISPNNQITAAIVFPFKRGKDINQRFIARALVRLFLVEETASGLRVANGPLTALRPSSDSEWEAQNPQAPFSLNGQSMTVPPFVISMVSRDESVDTANKDIQEQRDVAIGNGNGNSVSFQFAPPNGYENQIVFTKKVETEITPAAQPGLQPTENALPPEFRFNVSPFAADGTPVERNGDHWFTEEDFNTTFGSRKFTFHAAVWIMIENPDGDVVDLVPAIAQDDALYNGINGNFVQTEGYDGLGTGVPLFRFRTDQSAAFNASADPPLAIPPGNWTPGSYCAVDPRFNWAPEDWLPRNSAVTGDAWVEWVTGTNPDNGTDELLAEGGRDTDVFMFVSNQGFLQSMGEFAFLPRITDFDNPAKAGAPSTQVDLLKQGNVGLNGAEKDIGSAKWSDIAHANCAWQTYGIYGHDDTTSDFQNMMDFRNYYSYGGRQINTTAVRDFGDHGVRVNPYSDNESALMSAFAYTPYDWWAAAGTNTCYHSSIDDSSNARDKKAQRSSNFGKLDTEYVFCGSSQQAQLSDGNLKNIANTITSALRSNASGRWQTAYDMLDWFGNNIDPKNENSFNNFLGVSVDSPLHSVDRKFLYSFWRGCFANRQQLFLVFVRAESMALGGSGEGQIPPQQGGRAVALVWRDPEAPNGGNDAAQIDSTSYRPHQTRVLFYHQFD